VLVAGGLALFGLLAAVHLTQGTSAVGPQDVWRVVTGQGTDQEAAVVMLARLPRLLAAVLVGVALGAAGSVLQGLARNPLASPDTLAVEAGAFLALTAVAAFGLALPLLTGAGVAFAGGLLAAASVLMLSGGGATSPVRLVLAGSVIALGLAAITSALLIFFAQETRGLYAWGAGSLGQRDLDGVVTMAPVVGVALALVLVFARELDVLELGEETARSLGVAVGRFRALHVVLAVLLAAAAVTVAGPIGFLGLAAPAAVRLGMRRIPPLTRHAWRVPVSALVGVLILLAADVGVRMIFGPLSGVEVPTGVVTTLVGSVFLVALAQRVRMPATPDDHEHLRTRPPWGRQHPAAVLLGGALLLAVAVVAALLLGDRVLLLGDLVNYATGQASQRLDLILDARVPRALAAALAGASLAVAGTLVQGVTRNALADPSLLGVSAGAGLGAVVALTVVPGVSFVGLLASAMAGAALAAGLVVACSARRDLDPGRLVLVGIGVAAGAAALTAMIIVRSDPWNQAKAITWLGGSTYGAQLWHQVPMLVALLVALGVLLRRSRELDLVQLDDVTPRLLGVPVGRSRLLLVGTAVLLTATATASVGVIVFVGLVAPHAARTVVGRAHHRLLPTAALLGAIMVVVADTVGRTVLAPAQLPAGLVTALLGTPYFVWLMRRTQAR
jgi:iron complex transport system permease protein